MSGHKDAIRDWFDNVGYPLEYKAAIALKSQGFSVGMDLFVTDPSGKVRQVDVFADKPLDEHSGSRLGKTRLIVECKHTELPWVVLSGFGHYGGILDAVYSTPSSKAGFNRLSGYGIAGASGKKADEESKTTLLGERGCRGHSMVVSLSKKTEDTDSARGGARDWCYQALQQVSSAASSMAEASDRASEAYSLVCIPVIVISDNLYQSWYDPDTDKMDVKRVDYAQVDWSGIGKPLVVHVFTYAGLCSNVSRLWELAEYYNRLLRHAIF